MAKYSHSAYIPKGKIEMNKFASSVRFKARPGSEKDFSALLKSFDLNIYGGALSHQIIDIGDGRFQTTIVWESEEHLADARDDLIAFLDECRDYLEELTPELGVTDPISGSILD